MKTRFFLGRWWTVAILMIPIAGCDTGSPAAQPKAASTNPGAPSVFIAPPATNSIEVTNQAVAAVVETNQAPVALPPVARPPTLSPAVQEVVSLAERQVDESVLLAFVEKSPVSFALGVDDILYLNDLGIPVTVVAAMLRHQPPGAAGDTNQAPVVVQAASGVAPTAAEPSPPAAVVTNGEAAGAPVAAVTPPAAEPAPTTNITYNYIYDTLSPYGTWVNVVDYGWCWRPTVVTMDVAWTPYWHGGRWLSTDSGWYWQSDYSWGWLPFHYGRWCRAGTWGWVWVPGTTWGPAWVSWRYATGYCGWAPLPPEACYTTGVGFSYYGSDVGFSFEFGLGYSYYHFVPTGYFCHPSPWRHRVPAHNFDRIYRDSRVANHYGYGPDRRGVINTGMGRDAVAAAYRGRIREVPIREVSARELPAGRPDRLERDGRSLAVYRPNLPAMAAEPPPHVPRSAEPVRRSEPGAANPARGGAGGNESRGGSSFTDRRSRVLQEAGDTTPVPAARTSPSPTGRGPTESSVGSTTIPRNAPNPAGANRREPGRDPAEVTSAPVGEDARVGASPSRQPIPARSTSPAGQGTVGSRGGSPASAAGVVRSEPARSTPIPNGNGTPPKQSYRSTQPSRTAPSANYSTSPAPTSRGVIPDQRSSVPSASTWDSPTTGSGQSGYTPPTARAPSAPTVVTPQAQPVWQTPASRSYSGPASSGPTVVMPRSSPSFDSAPTYRSSPSVPSRTPSFDSPASRPSVAPTPAPTPAPRSDPSPPSRSTERPMPATKGFIPR